MPAVIGDLSALKTARRKLTAEGLAEGEGFEPSIRFPVYTLSKRAPSATRPPLLIGIFQPRGRSFRGSRGQSRVGS